jgi:hypothetical protein
VGIDVPALGHGVLGREVVASVDGDNEGALVKVVLGRTVQRAQSALADVDAAAVAAVVDGDVGSGGRVETGLGEIEAGRGASEAGSVSVTAAAEGDTLIHVVVGGGHGKRWLQMKERERERERKVSHGCFLERFSFT